jgi:hypothetical protein
MANVVIACPICLQKIRAPESVFGRQIKCPQCKNSFIASDPSAQAQSPAQPEPSMMITEEIAASPDPLGLSDEPSPQKKSSRSGGSTVLDYLLFRRMVTPVIMTAVFYCGVGLIFLGGLIEAVLSIYAMKDSVKLGIVSLFGDLIGMTFALVFWRVWCELVILFFQILNEVRQINDHLKER